MIKFVQEGLMMAKKELIVLMTVQTDRLSTADNKPPTLLPMFLQVRIQLGLPTVRVFTEYLNRLGH